MEEFMLFLSGCGVGLIIGLILIVTTDGGYKPAEQVICEYQDGKWLEADDFDKSVCVKNDKIIKIEVPK